MLIIAEQILATNPCSRYTEKYIREICGDGLTPKEIADLDIPVGDRCWVLGHVVPSAVWGEFQKLSSSFSEELHALLEYLKKEGDEK